MGGFSETIRRVALQKLGERVWKRKINLVDQFWKDVDRAIHGLALPYEKTRIYQDGLPVCGREAEIVTDDNLEVVCVIRRVLRFSPPCAAVGGDLIFKFFAVSERDFIMLFSPAGK